MANTLKIKLILLGGCLSFLVLLNFYQNNFYKEVKISKWRQLEWTDFQGTKKPFTQYDAGITSKVYLEKDSLGQYRAYAGQNNQKSWVRSTSEDYTDLLRHEQYHFNITEVFSRKLNQFIKDNPDKSVHEYRRQLINHRREIIQMQIQYDNEADHGLNQSKQWIWEYRIDSMLLGLSEKNPLYTEPYSGGSIYFPSEPKPVLDLGFYEELAVKGAILKRYGMELIIVVSQNPAYDHSDFSSSLELNLKADKSVINYERFGNRHSWLTLDSTNNQSFYQSRIAEKGYLYAASAEFNGDLQDSLAFSNIAKNFINSLEVSETSQYWIDKSLTAYSAKTVAITSGDYEDDNEECFVLRRSELNGFYAPTIIAESDSLIIPYKVIGHPDSLIYKSVLLLGTDIYDALAVSPSEFIFKVPQEGLPKRQFLADIGYLLYRDSTEGCYQYYRQSILIDPITRRN